MKPGVYRLRKEFQDRESKGLGMLLTGETVATKQATDFEGERFYSHMKKWLLTEEELDLHGYPRESTERGRAIIRNQAQTDYSSVDENQRRCGRCGKNYMVDDDGWPLFEEECLYHPLKKRTIRREQIYLCCKSSDESGCAMCHTHVFDGLPLHQLDGTDRPAKLLISSPASICYRLPNDVAAGIHKRRPQPTGLRPRLRNVLHHQRP